MDINLYSNANFDPRLFHAVGRVTGLLDEIQTVQPLQAHPNQFITSTETEIYRPEKTGGRFITITASGKGKSSRAAHLACLGEFCERYALRFPEAQTEKPVSVSDFEPEGGETVPPKEFQFFDEKSIKKAGAEACDATTPLYWTSGVEIISNEIRWLPTQAVYFDVPLIFDQPAHFITTSNGCAVHSSSQEAIKSAILELIERDAVMRTWYEHRRPDEIQVESIPLEDDEFSIELPETVWDIHFLALPSQVDLPVILCLLLKCDQSQPRYSIGASAGFSMLEAIKDAYLEACQGVWYFELLADEVEEAELDPDTIDNFDDNIAYYCTGDRIEELDFLLKGPTSVYRNDANDIQNHRQLISELKSLGYQLLMTEITTDVIDELGLTAVRVLSPDLVPLTPPSFPPSSHPGLERLYWNKPHPFP